MENRTYDKAFTLPFDLKIKKEFTNELQWHTDFNIYFILQGSLNINLKGRGHLLNQNDIYFIEPFHSFSIIATSADIRVFCISIDYSFLKEIVPHMDAIQYTTNYVRVSNVMEEHLLLSQHIGQLILHSIKEGTCENLKCISAVSNMMTVLIEAYGEKGQESAPQISFTQERIREIITYINEHYHEKILLEDISSYLNIHPQYFSTFFKKHFNKNFIEYLTDYRIHRSIPILLETNESILNIAISHGFNNHKTYSMAFKKVFDTSPSLYKKDYLAVIPTIATNPAEDGVFYYFQKFWNNNFGAATSPKAIQTHLSVEMDLTADKIPSFQNKQPLFIDAGRASSCLRSEMQAQIRLTKNELDFDYIRLRDIFSDDLFIYHEEEDKVPSFNWQYIDIIFDFLVSIKLKPFIEIGFMPRHLASKKQYAGYNFHPNVSFPKSTEKWSLLVSSFMRHCIDRFGLNEVCSWYFDFWICPDLPITNGFWNESREKFFEFYLVTYRAIESVSDRIRFGSPTFSAANGLPWYEAFFAFCKLHDLSPAYATIHIYGIDQFVQGGEFLTYSNTEIKHNALPDPDYMSRQLAVLQELMNQSGFPDLKIIASNWNISYYPRDLTRDTSFMGPYIAYVLTSTIKQVYGTCYRSLSDINEDFFPYSTLFHGGTGMVDFYGLKKASYNAYYLFTRLGKTILMTNEKYIITQSERGYQLMIFNLSFYDSLYRFSDRSALSYEQRYNIYEATDDLVVHILLTVIPGNYSIKKSTVSRNFGSAYDIWHKMGAPKKLDATLVEYIKNKSTPEIMYSTEEVASKLVIDTTLQPHELVLFEIERGL